MTAYRVVYARAEGAYRHHHGRAAALAAAAAPGAKRLGAVAEERGPDGAWRPIVAQGAPAPTTGLPAQVAAIEAALPGLAGARDEFALVPRDAAGRFVSDGG